MKITKVEPVFVAVPYEHGAPKPMRSGVGSWDTQDILFVRVETDAGVVGWGEAFSNSSTPVTIPAIAKVVAPLAEGRDPRDIDQLIRELTRRTQSIARSGPVQFALSGLDIALWDIRGKLAGEPVWKLLGGAGKDSLEAYASLYRLTKPEYVAKVAGEAARRGYRRVKLHEHSVEAVAAARAAVGRDVALMADVNCHWDDVETVVEFCEGAAPYDLSWLEEPLYPVDRYDLLDALRARVRTPIAVGENLGNFEDARHLGRSADIVQPSVAKIGGVSGAWTTIRMLRERGVKVVPHSPFTGPALVATVHLIAAMGEDIPCEHRFCDLEASPIGDCVRAFNGRIAVPQGPGLGFEVDQKIIAKYRKDV